MKKIESKTLLASIAVFGELCNTEKDLQSIIIEFIKSVYALDKDWMLTSVNVTQGLKDHFDFDFPEAVVRNCLEIMKRNGLVKKNNGRYIFIDEGYDVEGVIEKIKNKKELHLSLQDSLIEYYGSMKKTKLDKIDKKKLIENFFSYILDNEVDNDYTTIINAFILNNSNDIKFQEILLQIKEGLILTTGIKYTSDLNSLGSWIEELNIYIDTEIIFNAIGYNGEVHKQLFHDFFTLVNEINSPYISRGKGKIIKLKYFESTKQEIDEFFYAARSIIKKEQNSNPAGTAMNAICNGCSTIDDVIRKQSQLETDLKSMGIIKVQDPSYLDKPIYIIESIKITDRFENESDKEAVLDILTSFSKINYLRRANNNTGFDKCKHIILTGKHLSLTLSKDMEVKVKEKDIPFSTDIYFITNRFWFKLNKGFSRNNGLPATLDIITKAQIVLSSQINRSVEAKFYDLNKDIESGKLTKDNAHNYYYHLREKAKNPEDINQKNVNESIYVIFEDSYDLYEKEQSYKDQQIKKGNEAINELKKIKTSQKLKSKNKLKKKTKLILVSNFILLIVSIITAVFFLLFLIKSLISPTDTIFAIICGVITIGAFLYSFFSKHIKGVIRNIKTKAHNNYLNEVSKL